MAYPVALGLTMLVELPVWLVLLRARLGVAAGASFVVAVVVNLVSHPLLWFVLVPRSETATGSTLVAVVLAEGMVVVGEAALAAVLVPRLTTRPRPRTGTLLVISLLANALSWALGVLIGRAVG